MNEKTMNFFDTIRRAASLACLTLTLFASASAMAQQTGTVPVQGFLTDTADVPTDGSVSVTFTLYADDSGNLSEVWTSTRDVPVEQGLFSVLLGAETALDLAIFNDNRRVLLGIAVEGDAEMPLVELGATPYAGWAAYAASAGDATTVQGMTPDDLSADEDTLAQLTCSSGDTAVYDGSAWMCQAALTASDVDQQIDSRDFATNSSLSAVATSGDFGDLSGIPTGLADGDDDLLGGISCLTGQVVKQSANGWICAEDIDTTLSASAPLSVSNDTVSLNAGGVSTTYLGDEAVTDAKVATNADIAPSKIAGTAATLTGTQSFDNDTLYVDSTNDRVGVGTSSPSEALSVSGDVSSTGDVLAASFSYSTPKQKSFSVTAPAFRVPDNEDDLMRQSAFGGYAYSDSNPDSIFLAEMVAPVQIPDGATITAFRCQFYDNNSTYDLNNSNIVLRARSSTSTIINTVAGASMSTTGSSTTVQEVSDTAITAAYQIVDNSTNQYWMDVSWSVPQDAVGSSSIRFYGCHVDYTVDGPS